MVVTTAEFPCCQALGHSSLGISIISFQWLKGWSINCSVNLIRPEEYVKQHQSPHKSLLIVGCPWKRISILRLQAVILNNTVCSESSDHADWCCARLNHHLLIFQTAMPLLTSNKSLATSNLQDKLETLQPTALTRQKYIHPAFSLGAVVCRFRSHGPNSSPHSLKQNQNRP